jgi:hypothetical protein
MGKHVGDNLSNDPMDIIRATTLKRKNTPYCKQYCNHDANKKKAINNPKF